MGWVESIVEDVCLVPLVFEGEESHRSCWQYVHFWHVAFFFHLTWRGMRDKRNSENCKGGGGMGWAVRSGGRGVGSGRRRTPVPVDEGEAVSEMVGRIKRM